MHLYQWSVFFLSSCAIICLIGLASPRYHDNLPMCIGMCLLAMGCGSRASDLAWLQPTTLSWDWFFVHAGLGLFSMGQLFDAYLRDRKVRFAAFAQSTFDRLHHWPQPRFQATNHPAMRNSAAENRTKH